MEDFHFHDDHNNPERIYQSLVHAQGELLSPKPGLDSVLLCINGQTKNLSTKEESGFIKAIHGPNIWPCNEVKCAQLRLNFFLVPAEGRKRLPVWTNLVRSRLAMRKMRDLPTVNRFRIQTASRHRTAESSRAVFKAESRLRALVPANVL